MSKNILRNIIALVAGLAAGTLVNMGIVTAGPHLIPLPEGADNSSMEALARSMELFQPKHFLMPFLGHALGTLAGAWMAASLAASHKIYFALTIGGFFLFGGITMVAQLAAPMWFNVADLVLAYVPMALLGWKLRNGK
jgi:hypothetical protein